LRQQSPFSTSKRLKSVYLKFQFMTKPYTFFRLILPLLALVVVPSLLHANGVPNGNPPNGGPASPDSIARVLGHCLPTTLAEVNCVTHTIELSAWISFIFTGQLEPQVVTWSTGEIGHKITVLAPGTWNWDASGTGCEPNHWNNNVYSQPGSFFQGTLNILGGPLCPNSYINLTVLPPDNIYSFPN